MTTGQFPRPGYVVAGLALIWLVSSAACSPALPGTANPAPDNSRLPHLAVDLQGRPVLSWVEERPRVHRLVYSVLDDNGWKAPVVVAEGTDWFVNWADFPSVQPVHENLWAAHWLVKQAGGMYSYDVALSLSRDGGQSWDPPIRPHRDGTPTEHGFVSLWPARLDDGAPAVGAVWLDGRHTLLDPSRAEPQEPRTVLRSATFDAAGAEVAGAEVDDRVCDCCQTAATLTPEGVLVAYRDRSAGEVRDIQVTAATSAGWRNQGPVAADGWVIDGCPVNGPAIAAADHQVAVAWYTEAGGRHRVQVARRTHSDPAWSAPVSVESGPVLGRVDVALLTDGDAAVSWLGQVADGVAWVLVARVGPDGAVGAPLRVGAVEASRPAGFPQMIRHSDGLLLAWTEWKDEAARVVTRRVAVTDLPLPR